MKVDLNGEPVGGSVEEIVVDKDISILFNGQGNIILYFGDYEYDLDSIGVQDLRKGLDLAESFKWLAPAVEEVK